MITVLAVHFAVAAVAPFLFRKFGRNSFYALAAVPAGSFVWLILQHGAVYSGAGENQASAGGAVGPGVSEVLPWIPELEIELAFRMDALAWVMSLLVLGVGALVLVYCARYFKDKDDYLGGFGAQLLAFAGAMFGLVTADDLLLMFIFWELTTVLSYLLIGYARTRLSARRSALQALMVTTAGGLAMLVGLIMLGFNAGTYRISAILEQAPDLVTGPAAGAVAAAVVLILIGAITKSALVPFHFWLPGAMAAPTPVSAYLHAAAMVKAGIYLVARLAPGFAETAFWLPVVLGLGLATMLVGGYRALRQTDIKLILAYGTVSQLGFLTMVVGLGTARRGPGRARDAPGARALQGHALPGGGHHRPPVRNPRHPQALRRLHVFPCPRDRGRRSAPPRWPASRRWPASSRRNRSSKPSSTTPQTPPPARGARRSWPAWCWGPS